MMDRGLVWSAIRGKLPDLQGQFKAAVAADKYELESVILDRIARELADAVIVKLAGEEEKPVVMEESVYLKLVKGSDVPYA